MPETGFADRAEQFYSELTKEQYMVGAGLKQELDLVSIYRKFADLFAEPSVRERITAMQQAFSAVPSPSEPRPQTQEEKTRLLALKETRHLADFSVSNYIENAVKELTESIVNAEQNATVLWDDRDIPYKNIRNVIVKEPSSHRRHELLEKQLAVMVRQNPDRAKRIRAQHDLARQLGFQSYRAMIEQLRGWDLPVLSKALETFVTDTDSQFEEKLGELLSNAHVPRGAADTSDVAYILRAPQFDSYFPSERLVPVLQKTMEAMAMPFESTPGLKLDTEPRPLKSPRAFCAPVRVPAEVYLVIKPIGGQEDYRAMFHESGHAEHFSHVDPNLPFAFRYLGDEATTETFAFLFEHLTIYPRWLVDVLRVPMREAERYERFALFNKLLLVRRYAAKLKYELILHDEGPEGVDTAYREILGDTLHIKIPPERYLEDVDDAFYAAGYLRAWIFERQLARFLLEQFGEGWYESREAGRFLQSLWSLGMRDPVDELARTQIGAKVLDPRPLLEELAE